MSAAGGLRVIVGEDGIIMHFIASDGTEVAFEVLGLAEELDPASGRTMLQWCRDRVDDAAAYDLPADVREEVESMIAAASARIDAKAAAQS